VVTQGDFSAALPLALQYLRSGLRSSWKSFLGDTGDARFEVTGDTRRIPLLRYWPPPLRRYRKNTASRDASDL